MKQAAPGPFFPFATALLVLAMLYPVGAMLFSISPRSVLAAYQAGGAAALETSAAASLTATALATLLGVPAGYWLARSAPGLRALALFVLALPLAFPPVASGIMLLNVIGERAPLGAWLLQHGISVADAFGGIVAAQFFVAGSFVAITACAAFAALDPLPEEAARTLGAGEWSIFARIALPAAAANVAAGITFAWLRAIGEYGATSVVAYHPTSLPIATYVALSASGVNAALALSYGFALLATVVLGIQWILRRRVV